jgi:hypothetical protein
VGIILSRPPRGGASEEGDQRNFPKSEKKAVGIGLKTKGQMAAVFICFGGKILSGTICVTPKKKAPEQEP